MPTDSLCPYCRERAVISRDHIFSEFLGGSDTVLTCEVCNTRFGGDFEGRVSKQLSPLFLMLGDCGLPLPKPITWAAAITHPTTGLSYDLKQNAKGKLYGCISKTTPMKNESGTVIGLRMPDLETADKKIKELEVKSKKVVRFESIVETVNNPKYKFDISFNDDFRRLILKMCLAYSRRMNIDQEIIEKEDLLSIFNSKELEHAVKIDVLRHHIFDFLAPPLSHTIYVEACPKQGRVYAIVRLFGTFQFFTTLHRNYRGVPFSGIGILNPLDFSEEFKQIKPLNVLEQSQYFLNFPTGFPLRNMWRHLDNQVFKAFGKNVRSFAPTDAQMFYLHV